MQAITFLGTIGDYIVSGAKDGFVRFYDPLLRIVAWFEDLDAGPVTSVSFSSVLPTKVGGVASLCLCCMLHTVCTKVSGCDFWCAECAPTKLGAWGIHAERAVVVEWSSPTKIFE